MHRLLILLILLAAACQPTRQLTRAEQVDKRFSDHFTGFILMDPESGKVLEALNADHYFTPASNTKLLTLYTCLRLLSDNSPVFLTLHKEPYTYLQPTGYPLLPYPNRPTDMDVLRSLQQLPGDTLILLPGKMESEKYGPGWAWDDQYYGFQAERYPVSLYGNTLHLDRSADHFPIRMYPLIFPVETDTELTEPARFPDQNRFFLPPFSANLPEFHFRIPFLATDTTFCQLLEDRLQRPVRPARLQMIGKQLTDTIFAASPIDSLYKFVMQESDNHLAEQLLLHASFGRDSSLSVESVIRFSLDSILYFLPDVPVWVDGSGLSRYNLLTPRSIAVLLQQMLVEFGPERMLHLLPTGGRSGTIRNWYAKEPPFVFAKTGTLRNNHCLSGYIRTKKGKLLVFSFMHANFNGPNAEIKKEMEVVLQAIYESY